MLPPPPESVIAPCTGGSPSKIFAPFSAAYLRNEQYDIAIQHLNTAAKLDPGQASIFYNRGYAHATNGQIDLAVSDYQKTLQRDPNYSTVFFPLGLMLLGKREYDDAISLFDKAIESETGHALTYIWRGEAHAYKGNIAQAFDDYRVAMALDPEYAQAHHADLMNHMIAGTTEMAIVYLNAVIATNGGFDLLARCLRSVVYRDIGNYYAAYADRITVQTMGFNCE